MAAGCSGKPAKDDDPKAVEKEAREDSKRIYTGSGEATVRDTEAADRPILYVIRWEKTQLDYTLEQGATTGRLEKVAGEMYQDGKVASKFTADVGFADKEKDRLVLQGRVRVIGIDPKAKLSCQKLVWNTDKKRSMGKEKVGVILASGKVTIDFEPTDPTQTGDSQGGTIGPLDEMWCLPDLKKAGTPGFYR